MFYTSILLWRFLSSNKKAEKQGGGESINLENSPKTTFTSDTNCKSRYSKDHSQFGEFSRRPHRGHWKVWYSCNWLQTKIMQRKRYMGQSLDKFHLWNFCLSFPTGVMDNANLPSVLCDSTYGLLSSNLVY